MKLCYVVHRYAPFPGGSEYYVQAMAEESAHRGHDVTVFAGEHRGDLNGVKVTSDVNIFATPFDLIIVHGADVSVQNWVLSNALNIPSPILYLIILPSESPTALKALKDCRFLGVSTRDDMNHLEKHGMQYKAYSVRHSLPASIIDTYREKKNGFRKEFGITTPYMFISCGGFWPNKGMHELVDTFRKLDREDVTLVLTGYANLQTAPLVLNSDKNIHVIQIDDRSQVMRGIADADLYIMNSTQEGFGLVLLEAMLNKTPWTARRIAGAVELKEYGLTYSTQEELLFIMRTYLVAPDSEEALQERANYVLENRLIGNTVDDIEAVLRKCVQSASHSQ